jgi:hypothetical protein
MSGDNVDGSTNIIPIMDADVLHAGYRRIMQELYSPAMFYQRVQNFLAQYKPHQNTVTITMSEISALMKSIFRMGIVGPERKYYWKLLWWTLTHCPENIPQAITLTVYGYHFSKISKLHLAEQKAEKVVKEKIRSPKTTAQPSTRPIS